jgi:hypothetical protein
MSKQQPKIDRVSGSALNVLLSVFIDEAVSFGCVDVSESLGIRKMPKGYALMLNADHTHHYWLRHDGIESDIHWDKWAVYRGAKEDAEVSCGVIC